MVDRSDDTGQATVELALSLPIVVALLLLVAQVALVAIDQMRVEQAAREGARAAAVSPPGDELRAARLVVRRTSLLPDGVRVSVARSRGVVRVTVEHRRRVEVPMLDALGLDVRLTAAATMSDEAA